MTPSLQSVPGNLRSVNINENIEYALFYIAGKSQGGKNPRVTVTSVENIQCYSVKSHFNINLFSPSFHLGLPEHFISLESCRLNQPSAPEQEIPARAEHISAQVH